ncbi:MAG TPA: hypothetical protein VKT78_09145 [Fimbriimonadaceae bacterium]|nr:hypothetical protein [Fimbriimonadaceae bacterium]
MNRALAALLTRAIDYAGVFPPAKLELASALEHYIRYRGGAEAWILGRFAVRTSQLDELAKLLEDAIPVEPIPIAAIGRGGADRDAWEAGLEADALGMSAFEARAEVFAAIEAFETRLPDNEHAPAWIRDLNGFSGVDLFVELPWDEGQPDAMAAAAETDAVNVKARTGGENAAAFPSSQRVAAFIQGATQLGLGFKLTAGLHHAFPHRDSELGVRMHGFVPVFAAAACSFAHDLSVRELAGILDIDSPSPFEFTDQGLRLHDWSIGLADLEETRDYLVGFGSCSVSEPLETLARAGLDID